VSYKSEVTTSGIREEAKELVAEFAGTEALDALLISIRDLRDSLHENRDAVKWWSEFREHTIKVTTDYSGPEDIDKFKNLFREGFRIFKDERPMLDDILEKLSIVLDNMANDKYVVRLQESLSALSDELIWRDSEGNRYIDREATAQLASCLSEVLREQFHAFALPDIHSVDKRSELHLSNVVLRATLPDSIFFHLETYADVNIRNPLGAELDSKICLTASMRNIPLKASDMSFIYKGSTLNETGIVSVVIPPPGANLTIYFLLCPVYKREPVVAGEGDLAQIGQTVGQSVSYKFVETRSYFSISDMNIIFDESTLTHSMLTPMAASLFKDSIIDRFESRISQALDEALLSLGQRITGILNQVQNPLSLSLV